MHSSISSSNQRLPRTQWPRILGGALLIYIVFVGFMELRLALRGFDATVLDSEALWLKERQRASQLGKDALILVGGSRIQLGVDLNVLRTQTGLKPVQLAIDGSTFLPVFEGLAADTSIQGTVIVDFSDHLLIDSNQTQRSHEWQSHYNQMDRSWRLPDFDSIEGWLAGYWRTHLRSYADGAQPATSLFSRLLPAKPTRQYLVTRADRSRQADYSKMDMPEFYYRRVIRHLGQEVLIRPGMTFEELEKDLRARIEALRPDTRARDVYESASRKLAAQAAAIQGRGGRVYFVMLPKSGLVRMIDDRHYPRQLFWDRFASIANAPSLHFEDVAALRELFCPDGSHLDYRQSAHFTTELTRALGLNHTSEAIAPE